MQRLHADASNCTSVHCVERVQSEHASREARAWGPSEPRQPRACWRASLIVSAYWPYPAAMMLACTALSTACKLRAKQTEW
jgi:hypothetical protein